MPIPPRAISARHLNMGVLVLALGFVLKPSLSAPAEPPAVPPLPSAAELARAKDLARLLDTEGAFHAMREVDLSQALKAARSKRQFELLPETSRAARRSLLRRLPHGGAIADAARRYELDGLLLAAVVEAESGFDSQVISTRGAAGLMQIMPALAGDDTLDLFDPAINLNLGARYIRQLSRRFDGDLELTLAAYNAGPGAVERFGGVPPYRETTKFVQKVLRIYDGHRRSLDAAAPAAAPAAAAAARTLSR